MSKKIRWLALLTLLVFVGGALLTGCGSSGTGGKKETYPAKSIEFVVPFAAGGGSDIMARMLVKVITDNKLCSQPIAVNNKPGGSGSIGYAYVAEKKGDPYYIASVSSSFYTAPIMGKSPVSYKDFTPICGLAMDTLLLVVREDSKYKSVKDVIDDAKARPKGVSVGGTSGTSDDAVMFYAMQDRTGTEMKYVPYNSGGEVMTALLGGHVDIVWTNPGEALGHLQAKKVRALAVASKERLSALPDVPTLKEQGIDLVLAQFRGIIAPKDIPQEAVAYLETMFKKVAETPGWKEDYLKKNMVEGRFMNSKEFAQALVDTTKMYEEFLAKMKK
ncbi:tripartite tricarboxylate transporter substrate binding protein [Sporolituus thermophilus]|uniref:Putative tricarboxylic transport membrane protein n=1 Tax=Sporolituus thermophilus DSM 23256 TaxID=1123285 RepID=A0A1G7JV90_9FIRM|nr:tripartite tricarboxylate transporter substrate binding protein [Sporolituus thermophilus]SDF28876.1 putative tricarboxylic transport membrane protein [Sporolituus thermophilus DSM 23256]